VLIKSWQDENPREDLLVAAHTCHERAEASALRPLQIKERENTLLQLPDPSPLEITFRGGGLDEIKHWALSFGSEAQVIEPPNLQELVRKDLVKTLSQYQSGRTSLTFLSEPRIH
jgi:predicted DNA-binding transcriptional regulator YafY